MVAELMKQKVLICLNVCDSYTVCVRKMVIRRNMPTQRCTSARQILYQNPIETPSSLVTMTCRLFSCLVQFFFEKYESSIYGTSAFHFISNHTTAIHQIQVHRPLFYFFHVVFFIAQVCIPGEKYNMRTFRQTSYPQQEYTL